jgi:hypothetical protein
MACVVTRGHHKLITIMSRPIDEGIEESVRWCEHCGAVVIDTDVDGRNMPGDRMKMRFPQLALRVATKEQSA